MMAVQPPIHWFLGLPTRGRSLPCWGTSPLFNERKEPHADREAMQYLPPSLIEDWLGLPKPS
jgi:hypothetical protein